MLDDAKNEDRLRRSSRYPLQGTRFREYANWNQEKDHSDQKAIGRRISSGETTKKEIEARYKELGDQIKAGGARIVDNRLTIVNHRQKVQIDISALATAFGLTNAQLDKFRRQPITWLAIYEIPMVSAAASRSAPIGVEKTDFHEDEASLWEEQEEEKKRVEWVQRD